jgi:hypothetical protein
MADQYWVIVDKATGGVIEQAITSGAGDTPGSHPRFHGFPWDGETMTAHMADRHGDLAVEEFDGTALAWVKVAAKAEAVALAAVDRKQSQAMRNVADLAIAVGEMQTWREIQDLKSVTDATIGLMTALQRQVRWPFLIALMTESGTALAGFRTFAAAAETELAPRVSTLATLSARALLARRAVRQAATAEAKLAASEVDLTASASKPPPSGGK